jgi:hypothetical protein
VATNLTDPNAPFRTLRRLSAVVLALTSSVSLQIASAASAQPAVRIEGPEIIIDTTERNFGEVFAAEELEAAFVVRNVGTKPLFLSEKSDLAHGRSPSRNTLAAASWRTSESYSATPATMRAVPS